jgi:hypothetical protein
LLALPATNKALRQVGRKEMTTWNYRIIHEQDCYTVHEVFYNEDGTMYSWTEGEVGIVGNTLEECVEEYKMMAEAFSKPILKPYKNTLVEEK